MENHSMGFMHTGNISKTYWHIAYRWMGRIQRIQKPASRIWKPAIYF
jgi:hypothetical protein